MGRKGFFVVFDRGALGKLVKSALRVEDKEITVRTWGKKVVATSELSPMRPSAIRVSGDFDKKLLPVDVPTWLLAEPCRSNSKTVTIHLSKSGAVLHGEIDPKPRGL
ncbi:MAG TPA: hypothetical protein VGG10_11470 [Rhizomicrobium sp.]|jgi:hypothetical protein